MKKLGILAIFLGALIIACGGDSGAKLEQGTPEYEVAKSIAEKVPFFDPDDNNVLVKSDLFEVRVGEFIKEIAAGMGNQIERLKALPAENLKSYLQGMAKRYGEQQLLLAKADKAGVNVTDAQVDSVLEVQFQHAGGRDKFLNMIESRGMSLDFIRSDIKKNLKINNYLEKMLAEKLQVSEEDIENYYNQDKLATVQHILLRTQGKSDSAKQEIRQKMEKILEEAKSGKDFGELAKKYSEDPGSKDRGGIYENFERGAMVAPFDSAAFSVPVGEISGIVETMYGYHILKVLDRKKEEKPLSEVHDQIKEKLTMEHRRDFIPKFIEDLKKEVHFEVQEF